MVSDDFKKNVELKDVFKIRSALLDYLIMDTTFQRFSEALEYAERFVNDIIDAPKPQEKQEFENDADKWDMDYLNKQKVALMTYFSQARIEHLKEVIHKVLPKQEQPSDKKMSVQDAVRGVSGKKTGRRVISETPLSPAEHNRSIRKAESQDEVKADNMIKTGAVIAVTGSVVAAAGVVMAETVVVGTGMTVAAIGGITAGVGGIIKSNNK